MSQNKILELIEGFSADSEWKKDVLTKDILEIKKIHPRFFRQLETLGDVERDMVSIKDALCKDLNPTTILKNEKVTKL